WRFAVSGDFPIVLALIRDASGLPLARELLRAHVWLRRRGFRCDLVVLSLQESGYAQELIGQLRRMISRSKSEHWLNRPGGIYPLVADQMSAEERILLESAARVVLDGDRGSLPSQLQARE